MSAIERTSADARDECAAAIKAALEKYGCALVGVPLFRPDGNGEMKFDHVRVELVKGG